MNLNAYATAEQTLSRLVKEASINLAAHITRIDIISQGGTRPLESFTGVERDLLISIMYSMNECMAVLNTTGSQLVRDAVFLGNTPAVDWYRAAIDALHTANVENEALKSFNDSFNERMSWLDGQKKPRPANADELDKAFANDDADAEEERFEDAPEAQYEDGLALVAGSQSSE